jgi:hypothetical protein
MHVRLDQVFVELLRDGRPVEVGDRGLVTVTSHHPSMPLVRYLLGDVARMRAQPCPCDVGSAWPILVVEGRESDAFVVDGHWVTAKEVDDALSGVPLAAYQLTETAPARYRLDAIPEAFGVPWAEAAREALGTLLPDDDLVVNESTELPMGDGRKFRFTRPLARAQMQT